MGIGMQFHCREGNSDSNSSHRGRVLLFFSTWGKITHPTIHEVLEVRDEDVFQEIKVLNHEGGNITVVKAEKKILLSLQFATQES